MNIIAHNADWQHPAITEQHAFEKAQVLLPTVEGVVYFAFPWATLIDKYVTKQTRDTAQLLEKLQSFIESLKPYTKVVTVCQHIFMLEFQNIFHKLGITDIFWTHAIKNQTFLPDYPDIHIHPFPLYPVQAVNQTVQTGIDKKYLFSFVGATINKWYLTDSRHLIVELLGKHPQAYICSREQWHYGNLVYKQQVYGKTIEIEEQTAYQQHSQEFQSIMQQSVFALCPSGSGPNSIRLWEAISHGVIPVVLADTYQSPVPDSLWQDAVVVCEETEAAIRALPQCLTQLAADDAVLAQKRQALKQLAMRYGVEVFIHDIIALYQQYQNKAASSEVAPVSLQFSIKDNIASDKLPEGRAEHLLGFLSLPLTSTNCSDFLASLVSYALLDSVALKQLWVVHPELDKHLARCLPHCPEQTLALLRRLNRLKELNLACLQ